MGNPLAPEPRTNPNKLWKSHSKKNGRGSRQCSICANGHGIMRNYSLNICRQCFRENAAALGFKKLN